MKMQQFAIVVGNVVLDLVWGDRLIAQITLHSGSVSRVDVSRQHERQSAVIDALQGAGAEFALREHRLVWHGFILRATH
ncbi:MAG TPA: hypothetical protein VKB72_13385 [Steroidobacteraceae bacterium]|nr:hypothetical protein [Steroidobacteraceae bacterium]